MSAPLPEPTPPASVEPVAWLLMDGCHVVTLAARAQAILDEYRLHDEVKDPGEHYRVVPLYAADVPALMARIERAEGALRDIVKHSHPGGYESAKARAALGREGA